MQDQEVAVSDIERKGNEATADKRHCRGPHRPPLYRQQAAFALLHLVRAGEPSGLCDCVLCPENMQTVSTLLHRYPTRKSSSARA